MAKFPSAHESEKRVLTKDEWRTQRDAHERCVDAWINPHLERRRRGERHPIEDFLWDYYPYRPSALRRWNPGPAVTLLDVDGSEDLPAGFVVNEDHAAEFSWDAVPARQRERLATELGWVCRLLHGMAQRPAGFGCFGMHEWAMVLHQPAPDHRHHTWPMRVTAQEIQDAIDDVGLRCTHFDAWRFFTPAATALNPWPLSRNTQPERDQSGCLHANMDVYKWSMRMQPLVPSSVVTQAFALARRIRHLDMAASPYDFSALGVEPIAVELPVGRAAYVRQQRDFAQEAATLRVELLDYLSGFAEVHATQTDTISP